MVPIIVIAQNEIWKPVPAILKQRTASSGGGGTAYWTDPYAANLKLLYRFDTTPTNGLGLIDDTATANLYDGWPQPNYATGPAWTNVSGQGWYVFDEGDDYIKTNSITGWWNTGNYTAAVWINWKDVIQTATPGYNTIVAVCDTAGNHLWALRISLVSSTNYDLTVVSYETAYAYVVYSLGTSKSGITNVWHHVAATKSGTLCSLYYDGALVQTGTTKNVVSQTQTAIGKRPDTAAQMWEGSIDDVRLYTNAHTAAAIATLYTNTGGTVVNSHGNQLWEAP